MEEKWKWEDIYNECHSFSQCEQRNKVNKVISLKCREKGKNGKICGWFRIVRMGKVAKRRAEMRNGLNKYEMSYRYNHSNKLFIKTIINANYSSRLTFSCNRIWISCRLNSCFSWICVLITILMFAMELALHKTIFICINFKEY